MKEGGIHQLMNVLFMCRSAQTERWGRYWADEGLAFTLAPVQVPVRPKAIGSVSGRQDTVRTFHGRPPRLGGRAFASTKNSLFGK
jgi:hypothetical protein